MTSTTGITSGHDKGWGGGWQSPPGERSRSLQCGARVSIGFLPRAQRAGWQHLIRSHPSGFLRCAEWPQRHGSGVASPSGSGRGVPSHPLGGLGAEEAPRGSWGSCAAEAPVQHLRERSGVLLSVFFHGNKSNQVTCAWGGRHPPANVVALSRTSTERIVLQARLGADHLHERKHQAPKRQQRSCCVKGGARRS